MIFDKVLAYVADQMQKPDTGRVSLTAEELHTFPKWNTLRLVGCEDGNPNKVNDRYPLITKVWREDSDDAPSKVYIETEDAPGEVFVLPLWGLLIVTA